MLQVQWLNCLWRIRIRKTLQQSPYTACGGPSPGGAFNRLRGDVFAASGDAAHDLLSITAVHPMREGAVEELLARDRADWRVVEELIHAGKLVELEYSGYRFYMRALPSRSPRKRPEN